MHNAHRDVSEYRHVVVYGDCFGDDKNMKAAYRAAGRRLLGFLHTDANSA